MNSEQVEEKQDKGVRVVSSWDFIMEGLGQIQTSNSIQLLANANFGRQQMMVGVPVTHLEDLHRTQDPGFNLA